MKRYKRVLVLVAVLAVFCIATLVLSRYEEKQEQIRTSDALIVQIPSEDVSSLSWEYSGGGTLAFDKTEEGWKYQDDENFPVSEKKIMSILEHFENYGVTFVIEDVDDYGQYGLDDPECTLHLTTAEGSLDLKMGDFSTMDQQRYIDIGDGNVYLVGEDPLDYVDASLSSMIDHDDTPGFEQVVDITFAGDENYTIVRTEDSPNTYCSDDDIYFTEQNGKTVPLDTANVQKYLNTVTALDLNDYVTYNATEEELASFGLDTPQLSVTVRYTYTDDDGETVDDTCVFHIGENREERAASDAAIAEDGTGTSVTTYVRIGDSQIVYTLDSVDYGILTAVSYDDLRHKALFWGDFEIVDQIDITLEGKQHVLVSELDEDGQKLWYIQEETPEETPDEDSEETKQALDLDEMEAELLNLYADSFTDEAPGEVEEIGLTLHLSDENFPTVTIDLYRYDGSSCLARVDGEPVCMLPRSDVMALVEAVQKIVLN